MEASKVKPRRILVLGVPRSGTTVLKRYLASNKEFELTPFVEDFEEMEEPSTKIRVWKKTKWINPIIFRANS
jgi:hypothetical protein